MNNLKLSIAVCFAAISLPGAGFAQESISPTQALQLAAEQNPRLRIVAAQRHSASLVVEQEENRYIPVLFADGGFRYGRTPRLSPTGTTLLESNSLIMSAGIAHTLPIGTQLSVDIEFGRNFQDTLELGTLGTSYDTTVTFQAAQPLLRGAGKDVGEALLRAARFNDLAVDATQKAEASSLAVDVLTAYWSLWSAQRNVEILEESLQVAQKQLEDAQVRLSVGAIAPASLVPIRIEIARAKESVVNAKTVVRQRSLAVAQLVGMGPSETIVADADAPEVPQVPTLEAAWSAAKENSYVLARLKSSSEAAKVDTVRARDAAQMKLDAIGSLQFAGSGTSVADSFSQLTNFDAMVVYAGLSLELPLSNRMRQIDVEHAELAEQVSSDQLEQTSQDLRTQVASLVTDLRSASEQLTLAREAASLARQNVDVQNARFEAGKGTTLEILDALASFREAEYRVVQVQVNMVLTKLQLDDAMATLVK